MLDLGWDIILEKSKEINNSIQKIHYLMSKYNVSILTKVNSKSEQEAKEKFLNKRNIYNIIFVPYNLSKADYVNAFNCILIDDDINNLDEWSLHGGLSILYNKDLKNIDSYGNMTNKYVIIDDLLKICDIIKNR